jgi:peptidoglycan/xylan/chitin deacetylase (PgdA/CDA1 family)
MPLGIPAALLAATFVLLGIAACSHGGSTAPTPTPTPTSAVTATGTSSPLPLASPTPNASAAPTPQATTPAPPPRLTAIPQTAAPTPVPATPTPVVIPSPRPGWRSDGSRGVVALTFDTDSYAPYIDDVLSTLQRYGAVASFGVTGVWAQAHPDQLREIVADGDTLMNHSWDHPDFTKISTDQRLAELQRTDSVVQSITGVSTKPYFRPPYGAVNTSVRSDTASAGYITVLWNVDPQGWRGKSAAEVEANVFRNVRDGSIVLFHLGNAGDDTALATILQRLSDAGYHFVGVGAILGGVEPTPTPTPSPTPTPTPTPTSAPTPTLTPSPMPTPTPSPSPSATATPTPSPTPSEEPTPSTS